MIMQKFRNWLYHSFSGCYGNDKLNTVIIYTDVALCVLNIFLHSAVVGLVLWILWGIAIFRMFSKNTYKRYQENSRYLLLLERMKDRDNRYYSCPKCRQTVRVPRGRGKIAITCPRCAERFIKKT